MLVHGHEHEMTRASSSADSDTASHMSITYGRVLLKISGEAFCAPAGFGIDGEELTLIAREIHAAARPSVQLAETFIQGRALRHLEKGRVVVFVAGTGNPFCTTDSAASLRAAQIRADVVLKATKVDGIYDKDPHEHHDAVRFEKITFSDAIAKNLKVMDISAFDMCRQRRIPIVVFNMKHPGHIAAVVGGESYGTKVTVE